MPDLKCPNCGAPIASDVHLCKYCQSPNPFYVAQDTPQPQMNYTPAAEVKPARSSFSLPAFSLPTFNWLNVGTFLLFGSGVAAIAYGWIQTDRQHQEQDAIAAVRAESNRKQWIAEHTGWQYTVELNSDSLVESRYATLTCREALVDVPLDSDIRESRNITMGAMYLRSTGDNVVCIGLPYHSPVLKPWEYKAKTFVKLAFDRDTATKWFVNDNAPDDVVFLINESPKALAKLKKSKSIRLEMRSAVTPDSIVKLTFDTEGFKW